MIKKIIQNIQMEEILFCSFFLSVSLIYSKSLFVHFSLPKLAFLQLLTILILVFWVYKFINNTTKSIPSSILISAFLLMLWWISTTFFALHLPTALYGFYGRYNGLYSHITYLLLFVICSSLPLNLKRIENILKLFVVSLVPVSLYSLYQLIFLNISLSWSLERPFSTIGHPVILAALLGLALPFSLTFFLQADCKNKRLSWGISTIIISSAIISTLSRGPWIGSIVSIIIVIKAYSKDSRPILKNYLVYLLLITTAAFLTYTAFDADFRNRLVERFKIADSVPIKHRKLYHESAMKVLKDYPVTGIGLENFRIIYPFYRLPEDTNVRKNITPTMVHNGYLQMAVTNGIPALFLYIVLILCVLKLLYKTKGCEKKEVKYLLTAFNASIVGYLIQDLSGWLEVALTPFFWVILGFSVSACIEDKQNYGKVKFAVKRAVVAGGSFLSLLIISSLFMQTLEDIYVDHMFWKSNQLMLNNNYNIEPYMSDGLNKEPDDYIYEDIAGFLYYKKFLKDGQNKTYEKSAVHLENAHLRNPYDPFVMIHRINLDSAALKKGIISNPSEFTEKAVVTLLAVDKYNPNAYEAIGRLRYQARNYQIAQLFFEKAKILRK